MNIKQYFILTTFSLCIVEPLLLGMDNRQLQPNFTPEEDALRVLATHCPEALRSTTLDLLARNPGISRQGVFESYTIKQGNNRILSKAMIPMIKAIWQEICNIRFEELRKLMFTNNCCFDLLLDELIPVINTLKNRMQSSQKAPIQAVILIDHDLEGQPLFVEQESASRSYAYSSFIASQLNLPINCSEMRNWDDYLPLLANPQEPPYVLNLLDLERHERTFYSAYSKELDKLMHSKHFVIITTFDTDLLKNKDGIMVVNIERPTMKDRLVTLKDLGKKHNLPNEIVQSLELINQIIPQTVGNQCFGESGYGKNKRTYPVFAVLDVIMKKACDIFLTNGKFDISKARSFFAEDNFNAFVSKVISAKNYGFDPYEIKI